MISRLRLQAADVGMGMTSQRVRDRLIERLRSNGIDDERVLNVIRTVPRSPVSRAAAARFSRAAAARISRAGAIRSAPAAVRSRPRRPRAKSSAPSSASIWRI